jgi:putative peptidoglycan lipid II flippase
MTALVVVLGILTVLTFLGAPAILGLYVSGFSTEKMTLAVTMTRILSPFLLLVALAAVAMGALNACGRFFLPALAPASFNVAAIVGVVALVPVLHRGGLEPALALAIGALVGGALQFLVQVPALYREGFQLRPQLVLDDPGLRRIALLMLPATLGLAATQINILVDTVLASRLGDGPITYLQLAFRLMQLPIGLFGVAIATANLARVSRDVARGDHAAVRDNVARALRVAALLTLPATCGLVVLREPIVRLLFQHGAFDAQDTTMTAAAVACYALGLFAYAVTKIEVPTFYALGDTRTPVLASVTAVSVKIAANFALVALLGRLGLPPFLGLALSTSLAAWINFGWLGLALRRRTGSLRGHGVVRVCAQVLLLCALMSGATAGLHALLSQRGGTSFSVELLRVGLSVGMGIVVVGAGAWWLGIPEARGLLRGDRGSGRRSR